mgnify:CR=1 FL=1
MIITGLSYDREIKYLQKDKKNNSNLKSVQILRGD